MKLIGRSMINDFDKADFDGDGKFDAIDISILKEEVPEN